MRRKVSVRKAPTTRMTRSVQNTREKDAATLARRRTVQPVGVDVLAPERVDDEEQDGDRHPGREALGDVPDRAPARR